MLLKNVFSFFICCIGIQAFAQQPSGNISGTVNVQASKQPVEFANVELLKIKDSSVVITTVTDAKGKFSLQYTLPGNYLLRCSFIGYKKTFKPITITSSQKINVGVIEIALLEKTIDNVTVTAKRSLINTSIDRKVYNVTQDIMATSGSASDILKNVPSVEVDIDGQVSLRGSSDVTILINGRPSPLMGKSRAEVLQQLPANSIERIEVITNPSARYKPDGTSGIINIVMKKNTKAGLNGTANANVGNKDRFNTGVTLNYKPKKFNLFGNYSFRKDARLRWNDVEREYYDTIKQTIKSYYTENSSTQSPMHSHLATLGAEYAPNKNNNVGVSFNYHNLQQMRDGVADKFFYDSLHTLTSNYSRFRHAPEIQKEIDATTFWEHNFDGEDHNIRVEFNVSQSKEQEDNHYTNKYYFPTVYNSYDNTLIKQGDNQQHLTIDYSNALSDNSKLEAGYDGSFTQQDYDFYGEYYDPASGTFVPDKTKTNRFLYRENLHAFYTTYSYSYKKFGYALGLRMENALINGYQVTRDSTINNNYFKLYPTLHLFYKLKTGQLQLNYSRRVHRPEGDDLNPFPEYQDPYNVRAGNPYLLPEIINSVEFGYQWNNKNFSFVPSLYYRYKQNGFTQVTVPINDSVMLTTQQNLSNDQSAGLELIFSAKAGSFFSANLSNNIFYNQIDASGLGYVGTKSIVSMSANFNSTFAITKSTTLQISCNYRSARLTAQGKNYPTFVMNAGVKQELFNKKLFIILTASDLLQTLNQKSELTSLYMHQVSVGTRDARIIYLGVSYRFGKIVKKANEEKMQFDNGL